MENDPIVPIIEGDQSAISAAQFDEAISGLRKWRDETGDHLRLHP